MNKAIIVTAITVAMVIATPYGCRTTKKVAKKTSTTNVEIQQKVDLVKSEKKIDSAKEEVSVKDNTKSDFKNVTYTKSEKDVTVEGFTITSRFSIDTTAKGDTLRFLSQEDDRVKVSVYFDRKTGQAVAEVQNKTRKIKTPFESISITNAKMETSKDSTASKAHLNIQLSKVDSVVNVKVKQATNIKEVATEKKAFRLPFAAWLGISVCIIALVVYIYFNWTTIAGGTIEWIKNIFKSKR